MAGPQTEDKIQRRERESPHLGQNWQEFSVLFIIIIFFPLRFYLFFGLGYRRTRTTTIGQQWTDMGRTGKLGKPGLPVMEPRGISFN
ncbi:hypothetical protein I7I53_11478 [Histoplasma capsulatum var. duboisii H88]|uniref:Uncharacterized protein n=1 Tax=Ajellomyces capsulatus (strain H88) TaxID=544711 RepID=A0A8A1L9R9_AJEC8|nr:hypothetical protein I7I53_11478 [Histoplasma capsulatum var. duboisii H88]